MPTNTVVTGHVDSRSIAIGAPPEAVLAVLADARRLPEWAPAFAQAVRPDGEDWIVDTGAGELAVRLRVVPEAGVVDLTRPSDASLGARMRVLPNGAGSAFVFTIIFPPGTPPEAVDAQMATIEEELRTVRALAEAG
jgi:hypothetical protein